jgi:cell division transport system ATP-binding protein
MVVLQEVSKHYPGRPRPALENITLRVAERRFFFLTGPSGAGKTTLLRLLFGADYPTSGRVMVGGADLGRINPRKLPLLRRRLGVIFQDFRLVPRRSVFENVALALRVAGKKGPELVKRVEEVLEMVGLLDRAGAPADTLSGGEQQRTAVARALVAKPALLLADEPTGNLDPSNALKVMELLKACHAGGATVVVATHDPVLLLMVPEAGRAHLENGRLEEAR